VRQDIPVAQQLVQSNHATFEMASRLDQSHEQPPYCVVIGVPDKTALFRVIAKLKTSDICHRHFYEPDGNMGLSAVATAPLLPGQRRALSNYRLWGEANA
jgi:hypothetical protein